MAAGEGNAQESGEGPQILYQNLSDGDVLAELPFVVQFCFAEPVDVTDRHEGGDFDFTLLTPEGLGLADRTAFQPDGYGVAVYPGSPPPVASGFPTAKDQVWTFEWRVTDAEDLAPAEGTIRFTIEEGGELIREEVSPCTRSGSTAGPQQTEAPAGETANGDGDGDTDVLLVVLLAAGATAGVTVIGLTGYLARSRRRRGPDSADSNTDDV